MRYLGLCELHLTSICAVTSVRVVCIPRQEKIKVWQKIQRKDEKNVEFTLHLNNAPLFLLLCHATLPPCTFATHNYV